MPVFRILEGFSLRYTDAISGVLYVAEDRSLSLGILLLQTDVV
jgi:hypothetical protein